MQWANFRFKKHEFKSGLIPAEISRVISNLEMERKKKMERWKEWKEKWKETGKLSQYLLMYLLLLHEVRLMYTFEEFSILIVFKR